MNKVSKLVTCWRMILRDSKILCFTDADEDVFFEKEKYICGGYFMPNKLSNSNELGEDIFSINGIIDDKIITRKDILSGFFLDSYLEVFIIDLLKNNQDKIVIKTGWFGEIKLKEYSFTAEICSLSSKFNKVITKCYSKTCRADFSDQYCKLDKEKFTSKGEVSFALQNNSFIDEFRVEPDEYYNHGVLTFLSGINKGFSYQIIEFKDKKIILDSIILLDIKNGDKYIITAGCDKNIETCINKFDNAINFRGEPYIPAKSFLVAGN